MGQVPAGFIPDGFVPDPAPYGARADGTPKGGGYFGALKRPDGSVSSEISIGVNIDGKEVEIPTLVPTLTPQEREWLIANDISDPRKIPAPIIQKATDFARQRIQAGKSPFAAADEEGKYAPQRTWGDTAKDVAAGFVKAAGRTVHTLGDEVPHFFGAAGLGDYLDLATGRPKGTTEQNAVAGLQSKNAAQTAGGLVETAAELALPVGKAAEAIPSTARAGAKFQEVMSAAKNVPVDVNAPGQVALRIQQMAEHGGSMPMAVNKFLRYVTDPDKPALTYEVARDFASNISRLSANEYQRLTPAIAREVANLRVTLNRAVADAAGKAGKGQQYAQAMNEYARAMKVRDTIDAVIEGAKRSAPYATAAGAGYWLTEKLKGLLSAE